MNYILIAVAFVLLFTHVSLNLQRTSSGKLGVNSLVTTKIKKPQRNPYQEREIPCPDEDLIDPCICSVNNEYATKMDCTNVTTESQLRSIFDQEFPFPDMTDFYMDYNKNSEIVQLTDGVFGSKTFQIVRFERINFTVSLDCFDSMTHTLEILDLWSIITSPPVHFNKDFTTFTKLDYIYIYIRYVPIEKFYINSPTLTTLRIFGNFQGLDSDQPYNLGPMKNLEELHVHYEQWTGLSQAPDTSGYPKLKHLSLGYNNISFLNTTQWMSQSYLDYFDIYGNAIEDIDAGFLKVAVGAVIDFSPNQLTHLEEEKWKDIFVNSSSLYLAYNPFVCGCDIAWLFKNSSDGSPFMDKIKDGTTCADGELFHELDPGVYQQLCEQP